MNPKFKKTLILLAILVVVIVLLVIFLLRKAPSDITPTEQRVTSKIEQVVPDSAEFPFLSADRKILFYSPAKIGFYSSDLKSQKIEPISDNNLSFIQNVNWSPDGQKAIMRVFNYKEEMKQDQHPFLVEDEPDEVLTTWFYDFSSKKTSRLDDNILSIVWVNENEIVYSYFDPETAKFDISLAKGDGSDYKKLITLEDLSVEEILGYDSKSNQIILVSGGDLNNQVKIVSPDSGKITEIFKDHFLAKVSMPLMKVALVPIDNPNQVKVINLENNQSADYNFAAKVKSFFFNKENLLVVTRGEKQNSDSFTLINLPENKIFPIDYDSKKLKVDSKEILLTEDGRTIFFTSDIFLYQLTLPSVGGEFFEK